MGVGADVRYRGFSRGFSRRVDRAVSRSVGRRGGHSVIAGAVRGVDFPLMHSPPVSFPIIQRVVEQHGFE